MKNFTRRVTILLIGLFISMNLSAGDFIPKPYKFKAVMNTFQKPISMPFTDLFEYPAAIPIDANLDLIEDLTVSITEGNADLIGLQKYEYYTYAKKQYLYLQQKANLKGQTSINITITYKGKEISNSLLFDIKGIVAADDFFDIPLEGTYVAEVLKNDASANNTLKNNATITIDEAPILGTAIVKTGSPSSILYTPNKGIPNYSTDKLRYTVTLEDGETSSATVVFSIHHSSYASRVIDFLPAPGQFTNENIGKSNSAEAMLGNKGGMISLGGFGGYVILGFDQPIVNRPEHPYGVDFSIRGNSFAANLYGVWVEPAAVQVMKDTNGNGIPDDGEWYELAGSDYYLNTTKKNVEMTYYNPHYSVRYTIPWRTNQGESGALLTNQFHQHSYYPDPFDFNCDRDSVTYTGNIIVSSLDMSTKGYINFYRGPIFGYSDNRGNSTDLTKPNNPYFADEKGPARDGFDLNWAIDSNGKPVELDTVHFVKIYTAGNANAGWLGEWSSEVLGVGLTTPDPDYVPQDFYINYLGITQLKVLKGETCQYQGILFKNGRPVNEGVAKWWTSDPNVGTIDNTGNFSALNVGKTKIYFSQKTDIPTDSIEIKVVELSRVILEMEGNSALSSDSTSLIAGETIYITAQCEDNIGDALNGYTSNRYTYESFDWTSSNPMVGTIENGLFKGIVPGRTLVYARSKSNPTLSDSILVIVKNQPDIQLLKDTIHITYESPQGSLKSSDLFSTGINSIIYINSVTGDKNSGNFEVDKNILYYDFTTKSRSAIEDKEEIVTLNVTSFGEKKDIDVVFSYQSDITTGIEENIEESVFVYPNPFVDYLIINSTENQNISIYNLLGKLVFSKTIEAGKNSIDTSNLPSGSYLLKMKSETVKIIK